MTRLHLAFPLTLLSVAISGSVAASDDSKPTDAAGAPTTIKVASTDGVEIDTPQDAHAKFTIAKSDQGTCYVVQPPGGEGMEAGDSYVVVSAQGLDDVVRVKLAKQYPKCAIVDVVARVAL